MKSYIHEAYISKRVETIMGLQAFFQDAVCGLCMNTPMLLLVVSKCKKEVMSRVVEQ